MDSETRERAVFFMDCCKKTKSAFEAWVNSCGEEEIKSHFTQMAELMSLTDSLIQKVERILSE